MLLLLEVLTLDAEKALHAVASGEPVNETVNAFLAPSIQSKLDKALLMPRFYSLGQQFLH